MVRIFLTLCFLNCCVVFAHAIEHTTGSGYTETCASDYYKVVAQDGSGDYTSIQEAINSSKAFPYQRVIIKVKNGT